jgi:hypothetical protein
VKRLIAKPVENGNRVCSYRPCPIDGPAAGERWR